MKKINYVKSRMSKIEKSINIFMQWVLILVFSLLNGCSVPLSKDIKFQIDIWKFNSSMANTILYHTDNEKLVISYIGTLRNENIKVLVNRKLEEFEQRKIISFLNKFPLDQLKDKYEDKLIEDGTQIKLEIKINDKTKTIYISNIYQKNIVELIDVINQSIDKNLKLKYGH